MQIAKPIWVVDPATGTHLYCVLGEVALLLIPKGSGFAGVAREKSGDHPIGFFTDLNVGKRLAAFMFSLNGDFAKP